MTIDLSTIPSDRLAFWRSRRVLVLCLNGNSRSVGLAYILKDKLGADAIAAGVRANGPAVLSQLATWADTVIVMDARLTQGSSADRVPDEALGKLMVCDVGSDTYFRGFSQRLIDPCLAFLGGVG